jgi:sugar (pentulose or hexulose) kinase
MADVFGADVEPAGSTSAASLGGALRALQAHRSLSGSMPWTDAVAGFTDEGAEPVRAIPKNVAVYRELRKRYAEFEAEQIHRR